MSSVIIYTAHEILSLRGMCRAKPIDENCRCAVICITRTRCGTAVMCAKRGLCVRWNMTVSLVADVFWLLRPLLATHVSAPDLAKLNIVCLHRTLLPLLFAGTVPRGFLPRAGGGDDMPPGWMLAFFKANIKFRSTSLSSICCR